MPGYLDWLAPLLEDAQVPSTPESAAWLDRSFRNIVGGTDLSEEEVYRRLRDRWLKHGEPGRQLLVALIRDEVFVRRDSPMRPKEGDGYYTARYVPKTTVPGRPR